MKIGDLFAIEYPHTLIFSELLPDANGINFVSSQGGNNSVVGQVAIAEGVKLYPAGTITVPLKGTVLAAHVQTKPYYVAHQIAVLTAKHSMSLQEKLFYCVCIQKNSFRFSYGRQADKTLKDIEVPTNIPDYVKNVGISPISTKILPSATAFPGISGWKEFKLSDLFFISTSKDPNLQNSSSGVTPYISSTAENNGVSSYVDEVPSHLGNVLTIARNGSVGSVFYHRDPFCASPDDVRILTPKFALTSYVALFIKTIIELEKFRYTYGRKLGTARLNEMIIKLPATKDGNLDINYMEAYIKSLPYSDRI